MKETLVRLPRFIQSSRNLPRLPDHLRIYAIGDIHGRADLLEPLLDQIETDIEFYPCAKAMLVFLGDYIDRGPRSRDVIDILLDCARIHDTIFLKGNHEAFVQGFLADPTLLHEWRQCGGFETLMSYGLKPSLNPDRDEQFALAEAFRQALPLQHLEFFDSLELSFSHRDFFFVHAGIRPGVPLKRQNEADLLWIRDEFLSCPEPFEKFIVHGHTPVYAPDIRSNRINIDTGAFATDRLTAIAIEGRTVVPLADNRDWISRLSKIGATRADELAFSI